MLCVQVEVQSRKLFLWKIGVHEQKEKVFEMRRCNEELVTNMLPEHVAKHFLGTKKRDEVHFSVSVRIHQYSDRKEKRSDRCESLFALRRHRVVASI